MVSGFHATIAVFVALPVAIGIALGLYVLGTPLVLAVVFASLCWFGLSWRINDFLDARLARIGREKKRDPE